MKKIIVFAILMVFTVVSSCRKEDKTGPLPGAKKYMTYTESDNAVLLGQYGADLTMVTSDPYFGDNGPIVNNPKGYAVLIGDSKGRLWKELHGFYTAMKSKPIVNRAFGGSMWEHIDYYLPSLLRATTGKNYNLKRIIFGPIGENEYLTHYKPTWWTGKTALSNTWKGYMYEKAKSVIQRAHELAPNAEIVFIYMDACPRFFNYAEGGSFDIDAYNNTIKSYLTLYGGPKTSIIDYSWKLHTWPRRIAKPIDKYYTKPDGVHFPQITYDEIVVPDVLANIKETY